MKFAVIVVAHDSARTIAALVGDLQAAVADGDTITVVDNASRDDTVHKLRGAGVAVIEAAANLGFGGGCRLGADATDAPLLLFLNPDARIDRQALERLRAVADERPQWSAWQPVVMLPDGRINSAGGVVHYLGLSWAGQCGQEAQALGEQPYEAPFASGAALVVRRSAWDELGGFEDSYFLYCEDLDLGLRLWLAGKRVGVEPRARVIHAYEFDKGAQKWFLLERNRWRTLIAVYPMPLLVLLAPAIFAAELGLIAIAARGGWLAAKLRADAVTLVGVLEALRRRRRIQAARAVSARTFAAQLSSSLENPHLGRVPRAIVFAQAAYFALVRAILRLPSPAAVSIARSDGGQRAGQREAP